MQYFRHQSSANDVKRRTINCRYTRLNAVSRCTFTNGSRETVGHVRNPGATGSRSPFDDRRERSLNTQNSSVIEHGRLTMIPVVKCSPFGSGRRSRSNASPVRRHGSSGGERARDNIRACERRTRIRQRDAREYRTARNESQRRRRRRLENERTMVKKRTPLSRRRGVITLYRRTPRRTLSG